MSCGGGCGGACEGCSHHEASVPARKHAIADPPRVRKQRRHRVGGPNSLIEAWLREQSRTFGGDDAQEPVSKAAHRWRFPTPAHGEPLFPAPDPAPMCEVGMGPPPGTWINGASNIRAHASSSSLLGERLFPGFSVPVPPNGNYAAVMDEACTQVLRNIGSLVRAPECGPGVLKPVRTIQKRGEEALWAAGEDDDAVPPPGPASGVSKDTLDLGEAALRKLVPFGYRTESFLVPERWYLEWLYDWVSVYKRDYDTSYGRCGSVNDTLDMLWYGFRSNAHGEPEDYDHLMGCFDLHREDWKGKNYLFWSDGWGAPREQFRTIAQLISTFWEEADYTEFDSQALCLGFSEFLRDVIRGDRAVRFPYADDSPYACTVRIGYRNAQPEFGEVNALCWGDTRCGEGYNFDTCSGADWDDFDFELTSTNCYTAQSSAGRDDCLGAVGGCRSGAMGGDWDATLLPNTLAFDAMSADRILFLARLGYDFGRSRSTISRWAEFYETSSRIARYALRIAAGSSETWIHEIGHTFLGAPHCGSGRNCCFVNAGHAWFCRVRGRLGLAAWEYRINPDGLDYENPVALINNGCWSCSEDDGVSQKKLLICDTIVDGSIGETSIFLSSSCRTEECSS